MNYDEKTKYPFRYGADHRPPGWECLPPKVMFSTFPNETFRYGEVQTERKLTLAECRSYELTPIPETVMTLDDINERLDAIRAVVRDYETAHALEDSLHQDVLRAIADGTIKVMYREAAALALTSGDIKFPRYCA